MNHTLWINTLFNNFIKNSDIEIYFEEKEKLKSKGSVLNLSIHPIRFADDIFFNFETNDSKIMQKLKKYEVNDSIFYYYADSIKATYLKTTKINAIAKNSLLLVGQTSQDRVVFDGKKYLSLVDFIENIRQISQKYDTVYFKPHPYAKNNKATYKALKQELGSIKIIHDNIYHLLSNNHIEHVVALNSSVLYEAKYFNKKTTFLFKPYFTSSDIGIYGDYFNSSFWSDILQIQDNNISLPNFPNRLRKTLNDFWGYNTVSEEIIIKDIIKSKIKYFLSKYIR